MNYQFKGTQGPWKAEQATNDATGSGCHMMNIRQDTKAYTSTIATVDGFWYKGSGNTELEAISIIRANAAMITAAPKMFEALQAADELLSFHEGAAKPEYEGAYSTARINGEDIAGLHATIREAIATALALPRWRYGTPGARIPSDDAQPGVALSERE